MHYNHGIRWLKAFRESSEAVCALYGPGDDFIFEDPMLDQHNVNNQPDLHRLFEPYANKDRTNGVGIHNFKVRSYEGDENFGLIRWEWSPEDAAVFLGLDVAGKPFGTSGHTFHMYENGYIKRESSWWDASAVLRQVGAANPSKIVTGEKHTGNTKSADVKLSGAKPGTMEFAKDWCNALGGDTDALCSLYADWFTSEWSLVEDHMEDTLTSPEMMKEQLGGMASGEHGKFTFTPTDYFGNEKRGLIHWDVTIEGAEHFRTLPTGGKTLKAIGSTFLEFDDEGKIVLESSRWEDNRIFEALGLPVVRPHYWEEGFDPASLAA